MKKRRFAAKVLVGLLSFFVPVAIAAIGVLGAWALIAGGELFSTVILLGLVPALYLLVEDLTGAVRTVSAWAQEESPEGRFVGERSPGATESAAPRADRRSALLPGEAVAEESTTRYTP